MKKLIVLTAILGSFTLGYSQKIKETDVPGPVKENFKKNYPQASGVKWEKENENYEGSFKESGKEISAVFDASGKFLQKEIEIAVSDLPSKVSEYVNKTYPGFNLDEASKITDASGKVFYEVEIEKGKEEAELIFDESGNFLKKEAESGDDD
jgi:uncharacterized membrane protein YkoI